MNISDHDGVMLLIDALGAAPPNESFKPRFNVAPSMQVVCISREADPQAEVDGKGDQSRLGHYCRSFAWGMIPAWAKPGIFKSPLINARSETIWEKPSFRSAIKKTRVVIPVNGFYEWQRSGKSKQAWFICGQAQGPLAFAGVSSVSREGVPQVCIVTTAANAKMQEIHHRMPVILDTAGANCWLDDDNREVLETLMRPASDDAIDASAVGDYVNNARNEGPKCVEPTSV